MKIDGKKLISQGKERVYVFGDAFTRTVWKVDGECRFFVNLHGEFIEVYRKNMTFRNYK